MASVRILSVNCEGLGNIVKRTDVFNYLKNSSATSTVYKILILLVKMKIAYDQDGVMHVVLAHLHQMPGVLLFFLTIILNLIFLKRKETNGNYLVLDINVDKINFTLVSIYGPNDDNPQFYENNHVNS